MNNEHYLINQLNNGNKEAFSLLFQKYYKDLVLFAGTFLPDRFLCEDIVQNIFLKLWNNREHLIIDTSLKSFLLRSVQNSCLDELKHQSVVRVHEAYTIAFEPFDDLNTEHYVLYSDLQLQFAEALLKLPDTCREVFEMNRIEGFKYKEIAQKLKISERTVEVRIGKALMLLRKHLKEFFIAVLAAFLLLPLY
ncbi:MAG: RNA polymerase sigma-70 factor [Paludibacter sp.]|nr:RNA polymerase sigma-70 factor [Paludibacter sp.]